jgi:hypothetical protein
VERNRLCDTLTNEEPPRALASRGGGFRIFFCCARALVRAIVAPSLAIKHQVLGERHPDTALSLNNLGSLLQDQGDLAGAGRYLEQALAIVEQALGPEHPNTCVVGRNLAILQEQMKREGEPPEEPS